MPNQDGDRLPVLDMNIHIEADGPTQQIWSGSNQGLLGGG